MAVLYSITGKFLRLMPPELAHRAAILALKSGLIPAPSQVVEPILKQSFWNLSFPNPVGLAAGFDKNAEVPNAMLRLGFGFVEIGSVTPRPQPGNPRPRLFRLKSDEAIINRMGFNNDGANVVRQRLAIRKRTGIVGINLGRNKDSIDAALDYEIGVDILGHLADYLVINVSSPNTPGLRSLQSRDILDALLARIDTALAAVIPRPPLLLKIAPDLQDEELEDIASIALQRKLDGLIVSNTTTARPDNLISPQADEIGGLSGQPLFESSTLILKKIYLLTDGKIPLIGVGGIKTARQAYVKIRAGASLLQLYSALIYQGPDIVLQINHSLANMLRQDGFASISQAVGVDAHHA